MKPRPNTKISTHGEIGKQRLQPTMKPRPNTKNLTQGEMGQQPHISSQPQNKRQTPKTQHREKVVHNLISPANHEIWTKQQKFKIRRLYLQPTMKPRSNTKASTQGESGPQPYISSQP
jgi:hypothetical protein